MTDQPGSARFQALLESALQVYEKMTGVTLVDSEDSLAIGLQRCHSIDDITALLQDKAPSVDLQHRDRIFKSIKATVSILTRISAVTSVIDNAGPVRQKVLKVCLAFLTVCFYRNCFHMRKRYFLLSGSYWAYEPFLSSYVDVLLTSKSIRRPMA